MPSGLRSVLISSRNDRSSSSIACCSCLSGYTAARFSGDPNTLRPYLPIGSLTG